MQIQAEHDRRGTSTREGGAPETLRVQLLGSFSVSVGSRNIEGSQWCLKKGASLVKLLALAPGHRLHRERVMDLLWPNLEPRAASNDLRYALHYVRRILEAASGYLRLAIWLLCARKDRCG